MRSRRPPYEQRDAWFGYSLALPQLLGFLLFVGGPIAAVMYFSLHDFNIVADRFNFIGLDNYGRMFTDPAFAEVARNTVVFTLGYVPLSVSAGLGVAVLVDKKLRAIKVFRAIYFLPVVVSLVAWTIVWRFILQANGGLNGMLHLIGVDGPNWLRDPVFAMVWVVLVQMFKNIGLFMVFFLAALQGVPEEMREAAKVDGASDSQIFRHVTFPMITPFVFLVTVLAIIIALKSFALIFLMTNGGPGRATTVLAYEIYAVGFQEFEQGYASALAMVLFVAVLGLTIVQFMLRRRWVFHEQTQ